LIWRSNPGADRHQDRVIALGTGAEQRSMRADAPVPDCIWCISHASNPRYTYSLVKGSPLNLRLGFIATFLFDEKLISQPVDTNDIMDVSLIAEALKTRKSGR
jgi:hypothetical protein